jgi:hypothetical protein
MNCFGLLRRFASLRKCFAFVAANDIKATFAIPLRNAPE